ncbi:MAG: peptidylprolyl isomerase [Eubacteriales bacterium]|nr:peptidylprolyl isomerase [Eubacteriales bacterium]
MTILVVSSLSMSACKGIELENKTEQVEGYSQSEAMILLVNERNRYEKAYTSDIWKLVVDDSGNTFDKLLVQNVKSYMEQIKLLCMLAEERGITVNSQERDEIRKLSEKYMASLTEADLNAIGCSSDDIQDVYTDYYQANKLIHSLTEAIDSDISDSEAKVIKVQQIVTSSLKKAKAILKKIKIDNSDFETMATRYSEFENAEIVLERGKGDGLYENTAFSLDEGEVSNILVIDGMFYIIKCTDGYDEEATLKRKESLQNAINNKTFQEAYAPYKQDHNISFSDKFWKEISFTDENLSTTDNFFDMYREEFPEYS